MKNRTVRLMAVALAALSLSMVTSTTPAVADSNPITADHYHWPQYRWGGAVTYGVRAFWLFDRSNDPDTWQMMNELRWEWNTYYVNNDGRIPRFEVLQDYANTGNCIQSGNLGNPTLYSNPGDAYSLAILCRLELDPYFGSSTAGVTWNGVGSQGHATHIVPPIILDPRPGDSYETRKTTLRHEFVHLLGFNHSTDPNSLMYWACSCQGSKGWQDVWPAIQAFYTGHPMD